MQNSVDNDSFANPRDAVARVGRVKFRWPGERGFQIYIEDFALKRGERVLLLGPSGGGKSTLLSLLAGIVTPQEGSIDLLGTDITLLSSAQRDRFRSEHLGIIFQMFNLLPYGSVVDNVVLPLSFARQRRARAEGKAPTGNLAAEARRLLRALGLDEDILSATSVGELSVGQQQRVACARALIGGPEIILADEPTSALDRGRQQRFLDLLFEQLGNTNSAMIMVSHDESIAEHFDRVVSLPDVIKVGAAT